MNDFTTGSIPKKLLRFMIPIFGALVLQAMYGAVDLLIVGRFGTKSGISAVSTGSNIINLIVFTITGLSMGITVLLGQYIGEKKTQRCGKVIGGAICFFAMASFVAQNVGAGKEKRSRKSMFTGMVIGCSVGVIIMYVSFFHGDVLASIFTNNDKVIVRAAEYLRGFSPEAVVTSALFSFMGFYNGHSKTFFVMLQGTAQSFLVRVPMSIFMSLQPNASLTMIGLAAPTATVFGILINALYYLHYTKDYEKKYGKPVV